MIPGQEQKVYRAADGYHEIPTVNRTNTYGQTVVETAGGLNRYGLPIGTSTSKTGATSGGATSSGTGSASTNVRGSLYGLSASNPNVLSGTVVNPHKPPTGRELAEGAYKSAIDTLSGDALASAQGARGKSETKITNAESDLDAARKAAGGIGDAVTNVNDAARGLSPYEQLLKGQGTSLSGIYDALMGGDASVGGSVGAYLGATNDAAAALAAINPNLYAARAGADVQAQYDSAWGQQERELARRGVNVGSGAFGALRNQFSRALATAKAAAMTSAQQAGLEKQAQALTQRAGLFEGVMKNAQTASDQASQNFVQAAGIVEKQGGLFNTAGDLGNTQTNAFANIGGVEVNLGQLDLSNEKLVQDAYNSAAAMQQAMAKFYESEPVDETTTTDSYKWDDRHSTQTTTKSYNT